MRILIHRPVSDKSEFEPVDHMADRARSAIKHFAGERSFEFLRLSEQFELDLAEAQAAGRCDVQRQICAAYIWLGKEC